MNILFFEIVETHLQSVLREIIDNRALTKGELESFYRKI